MESGSAYLFRTAIINLTFLLAFVITPVMSAVNELPHEFSANYALEMYGTVLARATYTLEHTEDGLSMTQSTRPAGLVALLRNDKIDVRSDMVVSNGQLLLVNYDYTHSGDEKDRDVRFKINWQNNNKQELAGTAVGISEGQEVKFNIDQPVWDPLSIQVPIMIDAARNMPPHEHSMFLKGEFKHYLFENHGDETISFNGKKYVALKIAGRETKRDRAMYAWIVPELHYIPIKIEQWKNGKLKSTVLLESVSFEKNGELKTLNLMDDTEDYE